MSKLNFEKSLDYRRRIHDLVPGGAHTYSKGDDQFPELSPAAISRGLGAHVWDLDGNKFLDCSMGLTSVSLGHAYPSVIERVQIEIARGVNFQRPSSLELEMAENFLSLVPQHQMIKFAKNGSTVTTAAVKLARAKTGRPLVAFPGNHPFYSYDDWFIGKTQCSLGVPDQISALSVTFDGCNLDSLRRLFLQYPNQIACVITEPERSTCGGGCCAASNPQEFLREAIELCHKNGALFIVDEMITGFKSAFPGSISKFGISPDLATWGKGIANGFAFCALTGTRDVMELGGIREKGREKLFLISTTHGAETHAMAAAIATIEEFKYQNVVEYNKKIGRALLDTCYRLIKEKSASSFVQIINCEWMPTFVFRDATGSISPEMRTLAMQEMIKEGVLFQGIFVPCFSHTMSDIDLFAEAFSKTLDVLVDAHKQGVKEFLIGAPVRPVFRKYI
jgi:glutamate-1-semialdehyde aminotransferase